MRLHCVLGGGVVGEGPAVEVLSNTSAAARNASRRTSGLDRVKTPATRTCRRLLRAAHGNSWFAQGLIKRGRPATSLYPGQPDVGHAWAYLPDVAATIVRLIERERDLAEIDVFHFGGHWFEAGIEMAHAVNPCGWRSQASHPPVPLGPSRRPQSVRHRLPGNVGASIFVATPGQAVQWVAPEQINTRRPPLERGSAASSSARRGLEACTTRAPGTRSANTALDTRPPRSAG